MAEWAAEYGITDSEVAKRWVEVSERHYMRYQHRELTFPEQRRRRVREFLDVPLTDDEADNGVRGLRVAVRGRL